MPTSPQQLDFYTSNSQWFHLKQEDSFKTKEVFLICEELFEWMAPAATDRECRK